jgi:hypothetical protein
MTERNAVGVEMSGAEGWIRQHVSLAGPIELAHQQPWSTVLRVPLLHGLAWFKACGPVQAFEPRLTVELSSRWPDLVPEVLGYDEQRAWLLLADAGTPLNGLGNPPELWLQVLPSVAEVQRGETAHADGHLSHGVPDLRVAMLPEAYESLLRRELPLERAEIEQLHRFEDRFGKLCEELQAHGIPDSIQHDDLHMNNVYIQAGKPRVLDWGDSSISHPFASLVVTFRFLEETNRLPPTDPWLRRLRDAYLEPWGPGFGETFELAICVGGFAHAIASVRQRSFLGTHQRREFDQDFSVILRRALIGVRHG